MTHFEAQKLLLGDTPVPDLFIADHLASLDEFALKVYLVLLFSSKQGAPVADLDIIAGRLGITPRAVEQELLTLIGRDLVLQVEAGYAPVDLKNEEVKKYLSNALAGEKSGREISSEEVSERGRVVEEINGAFFQGAMSGAWYREIDRWFADYRFEPNVVYALFAELGSRKKLKHIGYARQTALNWHKNGVSTYKQLLGYQEAYSQTRDFVAKVAKKLRIKLNEFDMDAVSAWRDELGFSYDIVELALKKSIRARGGGSINYFDAILREWHKNKLMTVEAVEAYEQERRVTIQDKVKQSVSRRSFSDQGEDDPYTSTFNAGMRMPRLRTDEAEDKS